MKRILLLLAMALAGCTSSVKLDDGKEYSCIGLGNEERIDPKVQYEFSVKNAVLGVFFIEMIAPPIYVAAKEYKCPVGFKPTTGVK